MKIEIDIDDGIIDVSLSYDMLALPDAELADLLEQVHQVHLKSPKSSSVCHSFPAS